jgi:four helix bundle protein
MSRDFRKLRAFQLADDLVGEIYRIANDFPAVERYCLLVQLKRAAISAPANLVEGSARRTTAEFVNFVNIAAGSAAEARYLVELAGRFGFVSKEEMSQLARRYTQLQGQLQALMRALRETAS